MARTERKVVIYSIKRAPDSSILKVGVTFKVVHEADSVEPCRVGWGRYGEVGRRQNGVDWMGWSGWGRWDEVGGGCGEIEGGGGRWDGVTGGVEG